MKTRVLSAFVLLFVTLTPNISRAAVFTWISSSGAWQTAANWQPSGVPGSNDTAVITNSGASVSLNGAVTAGSIILGANAGGPATLLLSGQTLSLDGPLTVSGGGAFTVDSGNLAGNSSNATISGAISWTGGTLGGVLTITNDGTLTIAGGGNNNDMGGTTLINEGTVEWVSGTLRGNGSTAIYNEGLWEAQSDQALAEFCCGPVTFNNTGTFRKTAGASTNQTIIAANVIFNQQGGELDIQQGNLVLQGGGTFSGGIVANDAGAIYLSGNNFTVNGTVTTTNVFQTGGALVGSNVIAGGLTWDSGEWSGAASVTIANNATMIINGGGNNNDMGGVTVTNLGTVQWISGTLRGDGGTTVYNEGLWQAQSDQTFAEFCCGPVTFNNIGTFRKTAGATASQTIFAGNVIFNQQGGELDIQQGNLVLQGGGAFSGGIVANDAGAIYLSGNNFTVNGTVTTTNVFQSGGNLSGTNVINGGLTWDSGIWNAAALITIATNSTVIVSGGGNNNDMGGATVTNLGTIQWVSGTLRGDGITTVYNQGLWEAQSDQTFAEFCCGPVTINNAGVFRKTAGASTNQTIFAGNVIFNQQGGELDIQAGNLVLQGGGTFSGGFVTTNVTGAVYLTSGNSFTVNGTVTTTNVFQSGGNLVGTNVITGGLTWNSGVWDHASSVTVAANTTLIVNGSGNNDMGDTTVTNLGAVQWVSGTIRGDGGTTVYNEGLWQAQSDQAFTEYCCGPVTFNNLGIFRKTVGASANQTIIAANVVFNQEGGELDIQQGNLVLQGGGSFIGGFVTTNVAGAIYLSGGTGSYTVNGTVTTTNVFQSGGNLSGVNVINGGLAWDSGLWDNAASVTIATNTTLVINGGGNNNDMGDTVVTNLGTVQWVSGTIRGDGGTSIYNQGVWQAQSDQAFAEYCCGPVTFNNIGVFAKTGGTNTTAFEANVNFNNKASGSLEVDSGTLSLGGNSYMQNQGPLTITLGGNGAGQYGSLTASSASLNGPLTVKFAKGFVPASGSTFQILSASGISGALNTASLPFGVALNYTKTGVTLVWNGLNQSSWSAGPSALHGTTSETFLLNSGNSVQLTAIGAGGTFQLGTTTGTGLTTVSFNVAQLPNGVYTLVATILDTAGQVLGQFSRSVIVNNSLAWHEGTLTTSQTWTTNSVNAVDQTIVIPSGVTLTIAPGAVVKFASGAGIIIESGGALDASGATQALPIIFTSLRDNSVGGVSDENANSIPQLGDWAGISVSGQFNSDLFVQIRYAVETVNGAISADTEWLGSTEYLINGNVTIPSNVTVTVDPGAIVKVGLGFNITVQAGGTLNAIGTYAQPVVFTSINDSTVGIETNATTPAAGDWDSIYINGGTANFRHANISYGGGPDSLNSGLVSLIGPNSSATLNDCILNQGFYKDMIAEYGTVNMTNCLVTGSQRGIQSGLNGPTTVNVVNCTVDNNLYGLFGHGGVLNVFNSIISDSQADNVEYCCGSTFQTFEYNDVWSANGNDYAGISSQTGVNGNISANPLYVNAAEGNYQLNYGSPCIDAADSLAGPGTDLTGAPLYNDPRTKVKTGVPNAQGLYADVGAYNFEESASSSVDLIVTNVVGPADLTAGQEVTVTWNDINIGSGNANGPWHDAISLVPQNGGALIPVATVLEAQSTILGPNQSYAASANVIVPGEANGPYSWQVQVNSQGDVFTGVNWTNSTTLQQTPSQLTVTNLAESATASNELAAPGDYQWYTFEAPSNGNYNIILNRFGDTEGISVYVGQGYVPTEQNFDEAYNGGSSSNLNVTISSASMQPYYISVYAQNSLGIGNFTIEPAPLTFTLTGVTPNTVGNAGPATLAISGGELTSRMTYQVVDPGGTAHAATSVTAPNPGQAFATFDFTGLPLGSYSLEINGGAATLPNALTVTNTPPGTLLLSITGPELARPGRSCILTVTYTNTGGSDLSSPILYLNAENGQFRLPGQPAWVPYQFQVMALNTNGGPAGVLPPGFAGQLQLEFEQETLQVGGVAEYYVTLANVSSNIDWSSLEQFIQPRFQPEDSWSAVFTNFMTKLGPNSTYGRLESVLAQDATYFGQQGEFVPDVRALLSYEFEQADNFGTITARYHLGAFGRGAADPIDATMASDASGNAVFQTSGMVRFFTLQPDGTYIGQPGDHATVTLSNGAYQLREVNGVVRAFLPNGSLNYLQDNFNRITFNYSGNQVTSQTDSFGNTLSYAYNSQGRVASVTDPVGRVVSYSYDPSGEYIVSSTGTTGTTNFGWVTNQGPAAQNALSSITFPDGSHSYYQYDLLGRMTNQSLDGGAQPVSYTYDAGSGMTATDATGRSATVRLNEFFQPASVLDADGRSTTTIYDTNHAPTASLSTDGYDLTSQNNSIGRPLSVLDPLGRQTAFSYEPAQNQLATVTDPLGHQVSRSYDASGNLVSETYPDGSSKSYQYDTAGNLIARSNRRGQMTRITYNSVNLPTSVTLSTGVTQSFTYDAHRNLHSFTDASGTTTYAYDGADRVTNVTYPNGHFIQLAYNAAGERTQLTDQTGFTVNYSYDSFSHLSAVSNGAGGLIAQYAYDNAGRLTRKTFGNGNATVLSYLPSGLMQGVSNLTVSDSVISSFVYSYDTLGRITNMQTAAGSFAYAYDADNELTGVTTPGGSVIAYQYDGAGNRSSATVNGVQSNSVVNNLNQYQWIGNVYFAYDMDGNLTNRIDATGAATSYSYDDQGQLTSMASPAGTWTYQYNALHQRIAVTFNGQQTQYDLDPSGAGSVVAEYNGGLAAHYTYGLDLASRVDSTGNADYYDFDGSGNTANLTDSGGAVVGTYSYLPFGEKLATTSSVPNPFTFVGQLGAMDDGEGVYYMRYRWYDPTGGHFLQPDPAGLSGGVNLYRYAVNNPVHRTDANGLGVVSTVLGWVTGLPVNEGISVANTAVATGNARNAAYQVDYSQPNADTSGINTATEGGVVNGALAPVGHLVVSGATSDAQIGIGATDGAPSAVSPLGLANTGVQNAEGQMVPNAPDSPFGPAAGRFQTPGNSGSDFSLPPGSGANSGNWNPNGGNSANPPSGGGGNGVPPGNGGPGGGGHGGGPGGGPGNGPQGGSGGQTGYPGSGDPNTKITSGAGSQGYVTDDGSIFYTVDFANETNAAAPAAEVVVTDQLDPHLDWSTFAFQIIAFNNVVLSVPKGVLSYSTSANVSTDPNPVQVTAAFNPSTGLVTWVMESIDPMTRALPADPLAGFLPPDNAQGQGEGYVTYTVHSQEALTNNTLITNQATVVFDVNPPIATLMVTNTADATGPTSAIAPLPNVSPASFTVSWSGQDAGPGIAGFTIYASTNGGPWGIWLPGTTNTSAIFVGATGNTYAFYSVAYDLAGLSEAAPVIPGASTAVSSVLFNIAPAAAGAVTISWSQGTLLESTNVLGPWFTNSASSPYTFAPTNSQAFYKLRLE